MVKETKKTAAKKPAAKKPQDKANGKDNSVQQEPEFAIQRIYSKDLSFESPKSPEIFLKEWKPEVNIDLQTKSKAIEDELHEVVLTITVTAKLGDETAFLVEVNQAGIFQTKGFAKEQLGHLLGSFCPNILFPYVREVCSELISRGGFPPIYLAPVNFDALYEQHLKNQTENVQ